MVAKTPPKLKKKMVAPLDPNQLRETVNKVEKCMARLQELQYLTGGTKVVAGVNLSPRSTRGYLKTSLRCKQESLRIRNANGRKSPPGKLPVNAGEWRRMSLPAMLLGETVGEILQASQFAREIVAAVEAKAKPKSKKISTTGDPRTPVAVSRKNSRLSPESTELRARRNREKQITLHKIRAESRSPSLQRAKSRINFKVSGSSPQRREIEKTKEVEKENCRYLANRVSPKHRPWAKKTVLFPNPLFHSSSPTSQNQKFCRTKSPVIPRNRQQTPHKFLIKTPPVASGKAVASSSVAKFQVKIRSPPLSLSPTRPTTNTTSLSKKKSMSPPKKTSTTAAKLRRSFSPSRLVGRLVSPLKSRKSFVQRSSIDGGCGGGGGGMMMNMMSGLKQRPISTATTTTPMNLSARRI